MLSIERVMTRNVISINRETPIFEAMEMLIKHKISGLPVVDVDMKVVGILSEKDVLWMLIDKNLNVQKTVGDYMTKEVVCFKEDADAIDICKLFIRQNIRRVPIVRDGKLVGIISRRDIVNLIIEAKSELSDFRLS